MSFYPTKIKSVGIGTATDTSGRVLRFIGNLPCEAGDTVWTDGRVIFGNIVRKGGTLIEPPPRGIPVVADWVITNGTTCGYFKSPSGRFKKKRIAEDSWVVNAKQTYEHGSGAILDAEIAMTNGVEDGLYVARWAEGSQRKYVMQDNQKVADGEIVIDKDGQRVSSVRLRGKIEDELKKELEDGCAVFEHEEDRVSTSAELQLFHVDTDGKWTAVVKVECEVRRKYNWVDTSLYYEKDWVDSKHEYIPIPADSGFRDDVIHNLAEEIRNRGIKYGFLLNEGETLEDCLGRISLGVALANFFYNFSRPCMIEMDYSHRAVVEGPTIVETPNSNESYIKLTRLLKFTSDNINSPEIVSWNKKWDFRPVTVQRASTTHKALSTTEGYPEITVVRSDPVTEYEYLETFVLSHLGIGLLSHDKQENTSTVFYDTLERLTYSPRAEKNHSYGDEEGTGEFTFPMQDGYYQKAEERTSGLVSCAVYDSDDNLICGARTGGANGIIGVLSGRNNFAITPVGRGSPQSYLLGQREGALYRVTDSQCTAVGSGLKNCRLREMKNINKARK